MVYPGDWATVLEIAARPLSGTDFDATVLWCQALVAARSAAIDEAAKVADKYQRNARLRAGLHKNAEAKTSALDKMEAGQEIAAAIRELKDK